MDNKTRSSKEAPYEFELKLDDLETVSGGSGKSGGNTSGQMFLRFNFKLVAVKTVSWA